MTQYRNFISALSRAPDSQLCSSLATLCREFVDREDADEDEIRFLRNLRDMVVHVSGGSAFVLHALNAILDSHEEPEDEKATRRKELETYLYSKDSK